MSSVRAPERDLSSHDAAPEPQPPRDRWTPSLLEATTFVSVGVATTVVGLDGGGYDVVTRSALAIVLWWFIAAAALLRLWPLAPLPRMAVVGLVLFGAVVAMTAVSVAWAPSTEKAVLEVDRTALYLGVFVIAVLAASSRTVGAFCNGLAAGVVVVSSVALGSRFFPDLIPSEPLEFAAGVQTRLYYPVGYWTGLGVLIALALPLLLRQAVSGRTPVTRAIAVAPIPALVVALYLTSARIGVVAALFATAVFGAATARRWTAFGALLASGFGSAVATAGIVTRDALIDAPFSPAAAAEGDRAAAVVALGCIIAAAAYAGGCILIAREPRTGTRFRYAVAGTAALALLAAIVASDPAARFEAFKEPEPGLTELDVQEHLISGSSNGRWQLWAAAWHQWRDNVAIGNGAGSFGAWWLRDVNGTFPALDAHSLFLESLGELGVVGGALVLALVLVAAVEGLRRLLRSRGDERVTVAAVGACCAAWAVSAGVDWMWEFTIVTIVGVACLGLLLGPATQRVAPNRAGRIVALAAVACAVPILVLQAAALLGDVELRRSQQAAAAADLPAARDHANRSRELQPWASTPWLQLALIDERANALRPGRANVDRALERDGENWRLWLISARLATKDGDIPAARRALARTRALNPHSVLIRRLGR